MSLFELSRGTIPYNLIATDLDGTLLRDDGSISERTVQVLNRLESKGVKVVLVSARPPRIIKQIASQYGFSGLAICCNGALVYDLSTAKIVQHTPISSEIGNRIVVDLKNTLPGLCFAWERELEFGCEPRFATFRPIAAELGVRPVDFNTLTKTPFTKLIAYAPEHNVELLLELALVCADSTVTITHSGAPFIEISAKGVDKASALRNLTNELSLPFSRLIAFGDMPNDLPMLALAGYSVAVANAHPSLLAQVDEIALSNNDDGVAIVLERFFALV